MVIDCEDAPGVVSTSKKCMFNESLLAVRGGEPEGGRGSVDGDAIVLFQSSVAHGLANAQCSNFQVVKRNIVVVGKLVVHPCLVDKVTLAILHFPGLGVGVQHLT